MEYAACNVIYVDRTARGDRVVRRDVVAASADSPDMSSGAAERHAPAHPESGLVENNLHTLLAMFSEVHICTSGKSCVAKLSELNQASIVELIPTLVLIDMPYGDALHDKPSSGPRTPSPSSKDLVDGILEEYNTDAYGWSLLQWIATEIQYQSLSRLVVPVAVVRMPDQDHVSSQSGERTDSNPEMNPTFAPYPRKKRDGQAGPLNQILTMRYLDTGAVDVVTSPLVPERVSSLAIHAYRAHKDASKEHRALVEMKRGRKRSWVGVDDQKPYAYLREAMVSGLMDGICKLGGYDEPVTKVRINIAYDRRDEIAAAVGTWHFSAHDFTDDELLHAALVMLRHALSMPELEQWRMSTENLTAFLIASRSAYNAFVPYHNFRHVVDVLQACFHFLVRLGRLPSYPSSQKVHHPPPPPSAIAELIRPFDALTLLITAIGHDVGHPGVNNAFLVTLNAPLAQLYNDRSVLESFHCAAYSQILRRHWPAAFNGAEMRQLMISSILATDMGLHFDYMKKLGWLQEKLHENGGIDGWNGRLLSEHRTLACSLLIKCADISNVARRYDVASQWTMILTDEFARQASMEEDLGIPSALFAPPVREIIELGKSQLGFMNMFALPLFQGVTEVMPGMAFCVDELQSNKQAWNDKIAVEQNARQDGDDSTLKDGMLSPRTMSVATPSDGTQSDSQSRTDLRGPLPNTLLNGTPEEDREQLHHGSLPELSTQGIEDSLTKSTEVSLNRAPKLAQLQLSFATASTPDMSNGNVVSVTPSLVTDPVVVEPATPVQEKGGSSDGTEGSGVTDWASQATSATTGQMPMSPSTQSTSVNSEDDSGSTPTGNRCGSHFSKSPSPSGQKSITSDTSTDGGRMDRDKEKLSTLKKRPSRFRMNFWKRRERDGPSPPLPVGVGGHVENGGSS